MNQIKQSAPPYLFKEGFIFVKRKPNEECLADNVIFRYKAPEPRVLGVVSVITHHKVIILLEGILGDGFSIDDNLAVFKSDFIVIFVILNYISVKCNVLFVQLDRRSFSRDPNGAKIICVPFLNAGCRFLAVSTGAEQFPNI